MDDSMLAKVRKLLAKAEDPACTQAEAEALTGKATALMAKYGIDAAMAAAREPSRDQIIDKRLRVDPPFAEAKATLFYRVADPMRCKAIRLQQRSFDGKNRYVYTMHVFGYQSDIERVELLYTSLLLQAANAVKDVQVPPGRQAAAYRDSWLSGFSAAVYDRLMAAERKAAADASGSTPGVALVLYDRTALVKQALFLAHPAQESVKRRLSGGGGGAGYRAGQRADLGTTGRVSSSSRNALAGA